MFASTGWQQPTADELSMKSYPADPNASAVFLYREETVDDNLHMHYLYARIKILTPKGKEMFSDIEIPYEATSFSVDSIAGRTIHADGTVIPFTGKPYDKLMVKAGGIKLMEKVFSMPDVQVGSIIEYRYKLRYGDNFFVSPYWLVQQKVPVVKAHYYFMPDKSTGLGGEIVSTLYGHQLLSNVLGFTESLPPGATVMTPADGSYTLDVSNVPAIPQDSYMPPLGGSTYRLIFYYTPFHSESEYWKTLGKYWESDFDHFAKPSDQIRAAVKSIVAPGDSDQVKVQKIYAAIMLLDNTRFSRAHSAEENKAQGVKIRNVEDIWTQKRGTDDELTRLFVAMVRAAGIKAYGAIVVDRSRRIFQAAYLTWDQMDDELAIVNIGGKEVYLDPGQRYCEFGQLNWKHSFTAGIRETDHGTALFDTPGQNYTENSTERFAQLALGSDGKVTGTIEVNMRGATALYWRQAALNRDKTALNKAFEDDLQHSMPAGVIVKTNHFIGLTDATNPLMVIVNVSGEIGTQTGKHVFLPAVLFEAGNAPIFVETHRLESVDMNYPYSQLDQFKMELPPNLATDSLPQAVDVPFLPHADYVETFNSKDNTVTYGRHLRVADAFYKATEYPALREFFQKISADDHQQIALKEIPVPVTAPASAAPAGAAPVSAAPAKAPAPAGGH
jgi:hypothetical protein